jgi:hypothetical protein
VFFLKEVITTLFPAEGHKTDYTSTSISKELKKSPDFSFFNVTRGSNTLCLGGAVTRAYPYGIDGEPLGKPEDPPSPASDEGSFPSLLGLYQRKPTIEPNFYNEIKIKFEETIKCHHRGVNGDHVGSADSYLCPAIS